MLIKEQNNSNQSLPLIATVDLLISSQLMYLVFLMERLRSFWLLKMFDF